jgi:predicted alpha/beta superfamily hydrolase
MKKLNHILFLVTVFNSLIFTQIKVNITVVSSGLKPDEKIYIAGNQPEFGNWNPGSIALNKINDSTWTDLFLFEKNTVLEFKFTKGTWDTEALNKNESIPSNITLNVINDTSLLFNINKWKSSRQNIPGKITGEVRYHNNFKGKNILSRDVIVWLPPDYDSSLNKRYPVLYMQDGQNIIDPATSSFGADWQVDEVADSLIKANAIKELLIVGIYNTYQRRSEYANNDTGYAYMKFIVNELKPFIDSTYRTLPDRKNTAVAGSSLGGLISFMLVWDYSNVFSEAACLSPALKIGNFDVVSDVTNYSGEKKPIKIYIDLGGVGLESKLQPGVDAMLTALKEKGFKEGKDLYYFKDPNAEHNERAWSKRVWRFLEFMFGNKE